MVILFHAEFGHKALRKKNPTIIVAKFEPIVSIIKKLS